MDVKLISARIALSNTCISGLKLAFLSCYAPPDTESHAESTKDSFYAELSKVVKNHVKQPHKVCVLGDFKASIGAESHGSWRSLGPAVDANVTQTNGKGHRFLEFCDRYELSIENSRWHNKAQTTWVSATGFTKRIDYTACNTFVRTRSLNCRTRRGSSL